MKNKVQETQTFALRILKTAHTENNRMKDRYLRMRVGMVGAEWERFYDNELLCYAVARDTDTQEFKILHKYEFTTPYQGPEYQLYATLSHYEDILGLPGRPFLKKETYEELRAFLPEDERFCFCLANSFPHLTMKQVLGEGKFSKVWLASYIDPSGKEFDLALRVSRTDSLPEQHEVLKKLFEVAPDHWGAEFNAFLMDDPYAVDVHYALVWSNEGRFKILDKFTIQREKIAPSGSTYTLYATLSPFLKGSKTLTQYLKENPDPSEEIIRNFSNQLLLGIAHLPKGVNHRDLKPDNILVTENPHSKDPVLKLIDFGFSSVDQTSASDIRGTPLTMAPEMLLGEDYNLQKADMFALYAILHLMITGDYPFQAANMHEWQTKLSQYGRSSLGPSEILSEISFLDSVEDKSKFLNFMDRLGHPQPEERWTAKRLLEEDCFLRAPKGKINEDAALGSELDPSRIRSIGSILEASGESLPSDFSSLPSGFSSLPSGFSILSSDFSIGSIRRASKEPLSSSPSISSPPPSNFFLMGRLIFQITIATGILCIIHSTAKKVLQRYINHAERLPRPNIPVKA